MTARGVAWPAPVRASEPWSVTDSSATPATSSAAAKRRAATIGPTVCELDGPIPMENISSRLV